MPLRSIWSGTIVFGQVSVPIKVHSATEDHTVHFHKVHAYDGARIEHKRICSKEGKDAYRLLLDALDAARRHRALGLPQPRVPRREPAAEPKPVPDLMAALKESLEAAKRDGKGRSRRRPKAAA